MGIIDSILGRGQPQQQPTPQTPQTPQPAPEAATPTEPVNPLDSYAKMLENANSPADSKTPPSFNLDPEGLSNVAGKLNFTQGVSPELIQKVTSGDIQALLEVMNSVGQNAYKAALAHSSTLTDTHLNKREEYEDSRLGARVKQTLLKQEIASTPNLQHPVVKQEITRIAEQFAKQYPDATPAWIRDAALKYFDEVHNAVSPGTQQQSNQSANEVQDWESFLFNK